MLWDGQSNLIIHADCRDALKSLQSALDRKIQCAFIDPPYNTGNKFARYSDNQPVEEWANLIKQALTGIRYSLTTTGSVWICIDDVNQIAMRNIADAVFGSENFVSTFVWEKTTGRRNDTAVSVNHEYILLYAKDKSQWSHYRKLLPRSFAQDSRYSNPDNDPKGDWLADNVTSRSGSDKMRFPVVSPDGKTFYPPKGAYWRFNQSRFQELIAEGRIVFRKKGSGTPCYKRYLCDVQPGVVPKTWLASSEFGSSRTAREHLAKLLGSNAPFDTVKPEELVGMALTVSSEPGDWVLDCFAGSGTVGAVSHKLGRHWISIEKGDQVHDHVRARLDLVHRGCDVGGVDPIVCNLNSYKFIEINKGEPL